MTTRQRAGKFDRNSMARHPAAPAWGHINRRGLIGAALTGTVLAATTVPEVLARTSEQVPLDEVELTFFEPDEWALVIAICDVFIPADGDGPGAIDTAVPVFIDRQMSSF